MLRFVLRDSFPTFLASIALAACCGIASAAPTSVNVTGSLQSEVGCSSDFQPDCTATNLLFDVGDDVWQRTLNLPAGAYQYIATLDGSFDVRYGAGAVLSGDSIKLNLGAAQAVKFYYDDKSHWITDNVTSVIAVAAGNFQSELGCTADFAPDCLRTWLQDLDGDGLYTFTTSNLPAGSYSTVVAINESFDESYGQGGLPNNGNIDFTVATTGEKVDFFYDSRSHVLQVVTASAVPEPASALFLLAGLVLIGSTAKRRRDC